MSLRAVVFDLGNVLVLHDNDKLFAAFAARAKVPVESLLTRFDAALWESINRGRLPGDALRAEVGRRLGVRFSADEFFELWNCHFEVNAEMVPLVEGLLGRVKVVLLSNTHDLHVRFLRQKLPLLSRFDGLTLSCELGLMKPEPAIYRHALAQAGAAPEEAVFFDDVAAYVEGARAVGMHAQLFTGAPGVRAELARLGLAFH